MIFGWEQKKNKKNSKSSKDDYRISTVQFDSSGVSEVVKNNLKENINLIDEVKSFDFDMVYDAALLSISSGRDLSILYKALIKIDGMNKKRAKNISLSLNNKAKSLMRYKKQSYLGIEYAIWQYSGAPCGEAEQDATHKAANGKRFKIDEGLFVNGCYTWPGDKEGCKCSAKSVIPGFND